LSKFADFLLEDKLLRNITRENNIIQRLVSLRMSRNKRFKHKEFIIESVIALEEARKTNWPIKSLFYNADIHLSKWASRYIQHFNAQEIFALSTEMMAKVADKEDVPELITLGESKYPSFKNYMPKSNDVVLVLDEPKSAGNLGMIIRSANAFGVSAIVISGHAADLYDPHCLRSSVGHFFHLPIYFVEGIKQFREKIAEIKKPIQIIATGDKGDVTLPDMALENSPLLFLILGNETKGISEGYKQIASQFVKIPLCGTLTSLNIAAAASIFVYEINKRRQWPKG
jgi:tRNA G18 (ribose-2'-O)-methylase SpoU